jgi:hypothetical protein
MADRAEGGCLCGGVRFAVEGQLRPVLFCHCEQCRRTSGHYVAASACEADALNLTAEDTLSWYQSSDDAQRGFCNTCGASLFWRPGHGRYVSIMAGVFDDPNILTGGEHIYCEGISNYYSIGDGLPQHIGHGSTYRR